jgi:hypothetical protein
VSQQAARHSSNQSIGCVVLIKTKKERNRQSCWLASTDNHTAGTEGEGRVGVPGGWDARRRRRRRQSDGGAGRAGRRPSPACDAMAMEVFEWRGTEERGIFRKQPVREAGPRDRGRGSVSHQLGLRPVRGQRARAGPLPSLSAILWQGTSPHRQIHYRACISGVLKSLPANHLGMEF